MKVKLCYIYSDVDYSHLFDNTEKFLDKNKYQITTVFIGPKAPTIYHLFKKRGAAGYFIEYSSRKQMISVVRSLCKIFADVRPDIVHTHMVTASLAGLTAAKLSGIKRRVHTRHHSMECYLYYPHAVYYDKLVNLLSKRIIAISKTVSDVLIKCDGANSQKVRVIRHGLDLTSFKADEAEIKDIKRLYGLTGHYPIVGVISRFVEGKGIQYVIPAIRQLAKEYPQLKLVLANANGSYREHLRTLLKENLDESQYVTIEFEKRVFDLYKTFDAFVHVPTSRNYEAFGLTYVEALAMEVPSVFTLSGIANDFIEDKGNALVVPYCDSEAIYESLKLLMEDAELRNKIIRQGKEDVWKMFPIKRFVDELDALYDELCG